MKIDDRAFPLYWPEGVKRTAYRARSKFKTPLGSAREELLAELRLLRASGPIISTNLPLRPDGLFRIDERRIHDPGCAVYFRHKNTPRSMACDRWDDLASNIHALALTIEALRGIERWGSSDMVERAFTGFTALTPPATDWRFVFGLSSPSNPRLELVKDIYHKLAFAAHPDRGGSTEEMARLNAAMEAAEKELSR